MYSYHTVAEAKMIMVSHLCCSIFMGLGLKSDGHGNGGTLINGNGGTHYHFV